MGDGRVLLTLKTAWADGTRHLMFEPLEFLEKLAAITPRPRINLVLYHGVLAPHAHWRALVVAYGAARAEVPVPASLSANARDDATATMKLRHWAWANLMRRAFGIDVLACLRCGGRLRLIAIIDDAKVIDEILASAGRSAEYVDRAPPFTVSVDTNRAAAIDA